MRERIVELELKFTEQQRLLQELSDVVYVQGQSLERLEHLTLVSVTLGFSLLTIGVVTGVAQWFDGDKHTPVAKVVLTAAVWLVYAVVLHSPINPSFRGRKAAVLSVVGLPLMLLTILVVQFVS